MSKELDLDNIKEDILNLNICPELADTATQLVFGVGSPDAQIVFIGEAPGKNEDIQGLPFVGAAGKFLDEMLSTIKMSREDVYITNIVKYRPPNNRDPLPEEKEAFLPFLQTQLRVIKPKVVATLGRHSTNCFLPGLQISAIHAQPQTIKMSLTTGSQGMDGVQREKENRALRTNGTNSKTRTNSTQQSTMNLDIASGSARKHDEMSLVILPLYHPAAALYNGAMRQTLIDDFSKIPMILEQIKTPN